VWQGSAGDRRPYADQTGFLSANQASSWMVGQPELIDASHDFDNRCAVQSFAVRNEGALENGAEAAPQKFEMESA
jgi:hypothetical protein